jgi:hypothetical protein
MISDSNGLGNLRHACENYRRDSTTPPCDPLPPSFLSVISLIIFSNKRGGNKKQSVLPTALFGEGYYITIAPVHNSDTGAYKIEN